VLFTALALFPFYWLVASAMKTDQELLHSPPIWVPSHPTLGDVTSPEELDRYQSWKREYKKASRGA